MVSSNAVAVTPDELVCAAGTQVKGIGREPLLVETSKVDRKGKPVKGMGVREPSWVAETPYKGVVSMVVAGRSVS